MQVYTISLSLEFIDEATRDSVADKIKTKVQTIKDTEPWVSGNMVKGEFDKPIQTSENL